MAGIQLPRYISEAALPVGQMREPDVTSINLRDRAGQTLAGGMFETSNTSARIGYDIKKTIDKLKDEQDYTNNIRIINDFRLNNLKRRESAINAVGQDAMGFTNKTAETLTAEIDDILAGYKGNNQRRNELENSLRADMIATVGGIASHEAAQYRVVKRQAIEANTLTTDALIRENPDPAYAMMLINENEKITASLSGDPELMRKNRVALISSTVDALIKTDADKAKTFLNQHKSAMGDSYDKLLKDVEIARFKRDAIIDPAKALLDSGQYDVDPKTMADMTQYAIGQINQRAEMDKKIQTQRNEAIKGQVIDLLIGGDEIAATSLLNEKFADRSIDTATYRDILKVINSEVVTSDPDDSYDLEWKIVTGKAGFRDIASASGVSRKDKLRLASKLRSYEEAEFNRSVLKQQSYQWVLNTARAVIDPPGTFSTPETKTAALEFERALFKATGGGKTDIDPYNFYHDNVWRYTTGIIPSGKYGTPKTLEDVAKAKQKFAVDAKNMTTEQANLEAAKLKRAEDILAEIERVKANAAKRK